MARRATTDNVKAPEASVTVLRRVRTDADFHALLGPFLSRREVVEAVGGPVWDDDGKLWSVVIADGAVQGFIGATVKGTAATVCGGYVVPSADPGTVWPRLLADILDQLSGRASTATATVSTEASHFRRAGFKSMRDRGRFVVLERSIP